MTYCGYQGCSYSHGFCLVRSTRLSLSLSVFSVDQWRQNNPIFSNTNRFDSFSKITLFPVAHTHGVNLKMVMRLGPNHLHLLQPANIALCNLNNWTSLPETYLETHIASDNEWRNSYKTLWRREKPFYSDLNHNKNSMKFHSKHRWPFTSFKIGDPSQIPSKTTRSDSSKLKVCWNSYFHNFFSRFTAHFAAKPQSLKRSVPHGTFFWLYNLQNGAQHSTMHDQERGGGSPFWEFLFLLMFENDGFDTVRRIQ